MKFLFLLFTIFAISCSSNKSAKQAGYEYDSEKDINMPKWVYSPEEVCENKKFICASSEGASLEDADANARNSLASILEVKVKSNYELKRFGLTSLESEGLQEKVQQSMNQEIDLMLNGVKIANRFKKEKAFYSFAILEKKPVIRLLSQKIKDIDDKLVSYYRQKRAVFVNKMLALYEKRNSLEKQFIIVAGRKKTAPLSYDQIYQIKINQKSKNPLFVKTASVVPNNVKSSIEEVLTSLGYNISEKKVENYLTISFKELKAYLNVKGFQKHSFNIVLASYDKKGTKRGVLNIKKTVVARSKSDAIEKAMSNIREDIESDIHKLNID